MSDRHRHPTEERECLILDWRPSFGSYVQNSISRCHIATFPSSLILSSEFSCILTFIYHSVQCPKKTKISQPLISRQGPARLGLSRRSFPPLTLITLLRNPCRQSNLRHFSSRRKFSNRPQPLQKRTCRSTNPLLGALRQTLSPSVSMVSTFDRSDTRGCGADLSAGEIAILFKG